jgi:hypothetical protein
MTGQYKVDIDIPNPDLAFRAGVIGRARLPKQESAEVIAIPRDAVLLSLGEPAAFVVADDRARLRSLSLGPDQGMMVVVTEGLEFGDRLVVRGQRDLRDGSLVRVTEVAADPDGSTPEDPTEVTTEGVGSRIPAAAAAAGEAGR